jgi:hypothetical protein
LRGPTSGHHPVFQAPIMRQVSHLLGEAPGDAVDGRTIIPVECSSREIWVTRLPDGHHDIYEIAVNGVDGSSSIPSA